jgi:hypothetical protein
MTGFLDALREQRHDDHRFYHHSVINRALHFFSAVGFIVAYGFLFVDPAIAGLIGWGFSMVTRQSGHFFFEPKGYDHENGVSHDYKEAIKVGYNLQRKVVLMSIWALSPVLLWASPTLFGLIEPDPGLSGFVRDVGLMWLALGMAGLIFRTVQLFFTRGLMTGAVWAVKIITDPFSDAKLYWRAPMECLLAAAGRGTPSGRH